MVFLFEEYRLDLDRRELSRSGHPVAVEPRVFDLLVYLVRNRDRVASKDELIAAVWNGRIVSDSALASSINAARAVLGDDGERQRLIKTLLRKGVRFIGTETHEGGVALPELLDDLAALGMASVLVEGGAAVAKAFLADDLVDRIVIFQGPEAIGPEGIASPVDAGSIPAGFRKLRGMRFGDDTYAEWIRDI